MTRWVLIVAYIATIVAANIVTSHWGLIPAGFGLLVPAGTYAAGLALGLRDTLQDAVGIRWVLVAVAAGTVVSVLTGDMRIALASGAAFLLSELTDLAVYTPLRRSGRRRAIVASNAVGAVVDTWLFLAIAGFPLTVGTVTGQLLVKAIWVTLAFLLVREVAVRAVSRKPQLAEGA
ncbi:VUT family protein [Crossiella sp. CA-258035]|uniref:VUT family protein n=1 Tax=Crossiella sp. CA-258035 TaxID=2981138 RepID=UPI0024BC58AE|nr:VUT family protein [Crossiella sp. CA-258035]WHT20962.1 VUT family protein [Crossiella sp. CA-258035]